MSKRLIRYLPILLVFALSFISYCFAYSNGWPYFKFLSYALAGLGGSYIGDTFLNDKRKKWTLRYWVYALVACAMIGGVFTGIARLVE